MIVYADTSALAKWYIAEAGSAEFERFVQDAEEVVISRLVLVEMRCLLARRRRSGMIDPATEGEAWALVLSDVASGGLWVEPVPDARLTDALQLIEELADVPLRTLDAVHLAAARAAGAATVATGDAVMARAARQLRLKVAFFGAPEN